VTIIGYARSAIPDPASCDRQEHVLRDSGAAEVYRDDGVSGIGAQRPSWDRALSALRPGDTLLVTSADRVGRSAEILRDAVAAVTERGCELRALDFGSAITAAFMA